MCRARINRQHLETTDIIMFWYTKEQTKEQREEGQN